MNKADIIDFVSAGAEITKAQADVAVSSILDAITAALGDGDKVTLVGFGTFSATERAARIGRNPQTGAELKIPASVAVKFSPGKELKEAVKGA
ncbi:MAG TPA: HU family DNA-binding protein [Geobacteraceae bacterium]|nr:HU family DNA-binding protein [Geobacteraceae bacterium]